MKTTRTLTALGLVMGLAAVPALAANTLDADQNGEISANEWTGFEGVFADIDADNSGYVNENEFNDWAQTNWGGVPGGGDDDGPLFGVLDVNDDQQITEDEWFTEDQFATLDDNSNDALGNQEFVTGSGGQQSAQQQSGQQQELTAESWTNYGATFTQADVDQSGYIDEDEYNEWAATNWGGAPGGGDDDGPLFGLLDTNDDVQVTEDEWFSEDSFGELDDNESGVLEQDEFGL